MTTRSIPIALSLLAIGACSSVGTSPATPSATTYRPGDGHDLAALPEAQPRQTIDVPDGGTVALRPSMVRWSVNGVPTFAYAYNGQIPGPLLRAKQGSTFTVDVTNALDLPTTVHWHGIRLDTPNDGVVGVSQEAIEPGGSFRYTVHVPDAGLYWYHPHMREDIEQDLGLAGNLEVLPSAEDVFPPPDHEEILMLDDLATGQDGAPLPYGRDDATRALMGRFGNVLLVNGAPAYALTVTQGQVVRFGLTNAANTRTFRVGWSAPSGAAPLRMKLVESDDGPLPVEQWADTVTLAPAERSVAEVLFDRPGTYTLDQRTPTARDVLGTVTVTQATESSAAAVAFGTLRRNDEVRDAIVATVKAAKDAPVDLTLRLTVELKGMGGGMQMGGMNHGGMSMGGMTLGADGIEWEDAMPPMNAASTKANTQWKLVDEATGKVNMDVAPTFPRGSVVKIRLVNDAKAAHPMQHPIHLHGQRFLVYAVNGTPNADLAWKDTVLVPSGATVDLLVPMENPGTWMQHCHIAEHLTNGMMAMFTVR